MDLGSFPLRLLPSSFILHPSSFPRLSIFGPGLIGGSLALAARQRGVCAHLTLWSRDPAEREAARRLQVADVVTADPAEATRNADLIVLCTPPAAVLSLAAEIAPFVGPDASVTDVASVKGGSFHDSLHTRFASPPGAPSRYAGSHPMAGSERGGLGNARRDLFEDRVCLLTPVAGRTAPAALAAVEGFWQSLGMQTLCLTPDEHDTTVAQVSHLPHLLSAALASLPDARALACAGPGWRDMTRLAGGPAELWTEILSLNRLSVTDALRGLLTRLGEVAELLEAGREADLEKFLREAKNGRGEPMPPPGKTPVSTEH